MAGRKLLIIEDEAAVAKQLKWGLQDVYEITIAGTAAAAEPLLADGGFPVVTLDLGLPPHPDTPEEGFQLLEKIAAASPDTRVIVITGNAEEENAVRAVALGAADFCPKPIDLQLLRIILERTFRLRELEEANRRLLEQADQAGALGDLLGISPAMKAVFTRIRQAAGTDYPVLLTGESGTGKEMAARAIHRLSPRAAGPLVIVNCGAIPENLLESELFGYEKGAFTGAASRHRGRFEEADGGTVFLDEIGELPLPLQVKILRFLQEGTIERLGGNRTIRLDVRIVAASNFDLEEAAAGGRFRNDLLYRLNVIPLELPPLRRRDEDILLLAHHFLHRESRVLKRGPVRFSAAAIAALNRHPWPGNVRELQNRVRRALVNNPGKIIDPVDLDLQVEDADTRDAPLPTLKAAREAAEREVISRALAMADHNISRAARLLATSRPTLHDLLKKHGLA